MTDYQRIVDDIRSVLHSSDQTESPALRELASRFSQACSEVNQRLQRCEQFLRNGLRSEALQFSQTEPPVLDMVAILDFPERREWDQLSFTYDQPSAPKLLLATAEALNEAYASDQPLHHLLRKHRQLALAHATLPSRLAVMRQLKAIDSGNLVWDEDIAIFEKARIGQLESEVKNALREDHPETIARLLDELKTTAWQVAPPIALLELVEDSARRKQLESTRRTLENLATELHAAVAAFDVPRVRELRGRWNDEAIRGKVNLTDPLWDRATAAFDWLAKQDRHEAEAQKQKLALAKLESALQDHPSSKELEQRYRAVVKRDGAGIPEGVESQYQATMQALTRATRWRKRLVALAACMFAGLIVYMLGLWIDRARVSSRAEDALHKAISMRESGQLLQADEFLQGLVASDPRAANTRLLQELTNRVASEAAQERSRQIQFQEALKAAEPVALTDAGAAVLARAEGLAKLPDETAAVHRLRSDRDAAERRQQRQRDEHFRRATNRLGLRVKELEQLVEQSPKGALTLQLHSDVQSELGRLMQTTGVSVEVQQLAQAIAGQLADIELGFSIEQRVKEHLDRMTRALQTPGSESRYGSLLQEYVAKFTRTPRVANFRQALQERSHWETVMAWGNLIRPWHDHWLDVPPAEALTHAVQVRAFLQSHADFVDADVAGRYQLALEAIAQRNEPEAGTAAAQLRQLFGHFLNKDLWYVRADNKTYYLPQDPTRKIDEASRDSAKPLVNLRYLDGLEGNEKTTNVDRHRISAFGRARQSLIADKVARMPPNFGPRWDSSMIDIARQIHGDKSMDPILKLSLLAKVLDLAGKGSYSLSNALAPHKQILDDSKLDVSKLSWATPGNDEAEVARPLAKKVLDSLPPLEPTLKTASEINSRLQSALGLSERETAGWLAVEDHGVWSCRGLPDLQGEFLLCQVVRDEKKKCVWKDIGTLKKGKTAFDTGTTGDLLEGRVVFLHKQPR